MTGAGGNPDRDRLNLANLVLSPAYNQKGIHMSNMNLSNELTVWLSKMAKIHRKIEEIAERNKKTTIMWTMDYEMPHKG